jgi:hypothetical protein
MDSPPSTTKSPAIVSGPPVAIIGFFPRIAPDPNLLPAGYANWAQANPFMTAPRTWLMSQLLASGNIQPPANLVNMAGVQKVVASQEFRVAFALSGVSAIFDDAAGTVSLRHHPPLVEAGFTPDNYWTNQGGKWHCKTNGYHGGVLQDFAIVDTSNPAVAIYTHHVDAKLWWWYNFLQSLVVFHFAPWARIRLKYSIHRNGRIEIEFSGSAIPSQFNYVDWQLHSQHHMENISQFDLNGFITAGSCNFAPWLAHFVFP